MKLASAALSAVSAGGERDSGAVTCRPSGWFTARPSATAESCAAMRSLSSATMADLPRPSRDPGDCGQFGADVVLCTDGGAMVAALGSEIVARGVEPSPLDIPADSSLPVTEVVVR